MREEEKDLGIEISRGNVDGWNDDHKFGTNPTTTTTLAPITTTGTYQTPTTAQTLEVLSDDANDTNGGSGAWSVTVVGIGDDYYEQEETVTLDGTTPVALTKTWRRIYRMYVEESGSYGSVTSPSHAGNITLRGSGGGSDWAEISTNGGFGLGQSQIAVYTVPKGKELYILSILYSVDSNKPIDLYFFCRDNIDQTTTPYAPIRVKNFWGGISGSGEFTHYTREFYDEMTDVGFMAKTASGTAAVSAEFEFYLVDK